MDYAPSIGVVNRLYNSLQWPINAASYAHTPTRLRARTHVRLLAQANPPPRNPWRNRRRLGETLRRVESFCSTFSKFFIFL